MHDPVWLSRILPLIGAALIAAILIDIFLTVLFARIGSGVISDRVACYTWYLFRTFSKPLKRGRASVLSLCGPIVLIEFVVVWMLGLVCGSAMIVQPAIGTLIRTNGTHTSTTFATAMYIAGDCLTTVGANDYTPHAAFYKLFYLFDSLVGLSVLTLTLAYLLEIYNALQSRNTFATKIHLLTFETGDAALLLSGIAPDGRWDQGFTQLTEIAAELISVKESHHFYPALFYFKFSDPQYAMSRLALVILDTITLIKSGMDEDEYGWVKKSGAVESLWRTSMHLQTELAWAFLPGGLPDSETEPDADTKAAWRRRYQNALHRLKAAGIATLADESIGAEVYISLRARWDRYVRAFADHLADEMEIVDRALHAPDSPEQAAAAPQERLRSLG